MNTNDGKRPNILLILADDLGLDDLGHAGQPGARTPRLDALAAGSVRFSDFTVNPVGAPSRATLLTGRHFLRTGVAHVHGGKDFLHLDEETLPQVLRRAGYATGMWGKWQLGDAPGYEPWERGFDEAYSARLHQHFPAEGRWNGRTVAHPGRWSDEVLVDHALEFIARHRHAPWFAFLPTMSPHGPFAAPEAFIAPHRAPGLSEAYATLRGMVSHLDHQIGRLLDHLDATGVAEDTVVMFLSANGPARETAALSDADRATRKVSARRGWKGDVWENGVRSPLLVRGGSRWAAREIGAAVAMEDLFPTVLELAGHDPRVPGAEGRMRDGASLAPLLRDEPGAAAVRAIFNYAHAGWPPGDRPHDPDGTHDEYRPVPPAARATLAEADQVISVRRGPWKFLRNPDVNTRAEGARPTEWLVNLAEDPGEEVNLVAEAPLVAVKLRRELEVWWDSIREEPHSFGAPEFFYPGAEGGVVVVPAKAACALSPGLRNTATVLKGWIHAGRAADYRLQVTEAGAARVCLRWARPSAGATRWRVTVRVVGGGSARADFDVPAGAREAEPPPLELDRAGRGLLRVELVESAAAEAVWLETITLAPALLAGARSFPRLGPPLVQA
jgi:arylsulfatase A-like enzyme